MARISVVLPHPLGPSRPVTDPAGTARETPRRTGRPPRTTVTPASSTAARVGTSGAAQPLDLAADVVFADRAPAVDLVGVHHQAHAPAAGHEDRPRKPRPCQGPDRPHH